MRTDCLNAESNPTHFRGCLHSQPFDVLILTSKTVQENEQNETQKSKQQKYSKNRTKSRLTTLSQEMRLAYSTIPPSPHSAVNIWHDLIKQHNNEGTVYCHDIKQNKT